MHTLIFLSQSWAKNVHIIRGKNWYFPQESTWHSPCPPQSLFQCYLLMMRVPSTPFTIASPPPHIADPSHLLYFFLLYCLLTLCPLEYKLPSI